ncbi:type II toxin-antitoxin system CcdA family antitoxin [Sphingomonas sp. M1-B02]|uniref:type II toxin-antitoxin system CcdA family antitoxin n=1 Tax=Sphingomonas sp. M1-B02 TaxID=3114300 RepID=UPI00223FEB0B|nr:type II toxin-antitoxin system CcdA family antitoxin [Sphingomonas sp. S6-11]UZK65536.1 type II toxin-antitoxin system CcdA family antitoxin [Sphingomonas sp. S6-11]
MKHDPLSSGKRKAVNISLDTGIVAFAREAGLNLSQVCEAAIREATRKEMTRRWQEENRERIDAWNAWIDEHGLPLAEYRQF